MPINYADWDELVKISCEGKNYGQFEGILNTDESATGFTPEQLAWEQLREEIIYLRKSGKNFFIVDSTELRLEPEIVISKLCAQLDIEYNHFMIEGWNQENFSHLLTEKAKIDKKVQYLWYNTLATSRGVKPPTEIPPKLSGFPKAIRKYLASIALPAYLEIYKLVNKIKVEGKVIDEFSLQKTDPIFALIRENHELNIEDILALILPIREGWEGNFRERRK